ncbi:DUF6243 family protein [Actinoalloteichus hymeniacidonis]|uniref:Uncharacterized protein n=1 Tax=Actinoalloteichus hymeniacidonis TaxID=340345 RepID=A0AAC9HQX8_9PSEU|nr:DUF6243 family protein [Actinoalloteichus hymeniacidonis]AOS63904.1 hypothetical protein TL08_15475 [Actinoalloteichus hymeniacidonis]MBB5908040.1 hypothetical protein [Actinoalloteichus hymeniacidonis]
MARKRNGLLGVGGQRTKAPRTAHHPDGIGVGPQQDAVDRKQAILDKMRKLSEKAAPQEDEPTADKA